MKRTIALISFAAAIAVAVLAIPAFAAKAACCNDCCNGQCGSACCQDGCTDSCCQGK